ncbi:MAG: TIGR01777 family oxidoreductase [Parashewanella sp.]
MKILITGGTGFIGSDLVTLLSTQHKICVLTRNVKKAQKKLGNIPTFIDSLNQLDELNEFDVVINLAGEPIVGKKWTEKQKIKLCHSRWDATQQLVQLIQKSANPPKCFISASAIGFYGRQQEQLLDENAAYSDEFTHQLCHEWERIALQASEKTRVCITRIGIVLGDNGGALEKMLPAYKFGLGGRIANGKQGMSWIHKRDLLRLFQFLMADDKCQGIYNATAPYPVSNSEFNKVLGNRLRRPTLLPMPAFLLNMIMGEMSELLTTGQYVIPKRAIEEGFTFNYPKLENAIGQIIG